MKASVAALKQQLTGAEIGAVCTGPRRLHADRPRTDAVRRLRRQGRRLSVQLLPIVATLLALGGSPQRAPTPDELRLFDEGTHALAAGDARAAEKAWRAGYEIGHDPAFLVHIGEAEEKAGAPAEAIETYRRYLREAPDASDRADIESGWRASVPRRRREPLPRRPARRWRRPASSAARRRRARRRRPPRCPRPPRPPGPTSTPRSRPAQTDEDSGWNRYQRDRGDRRRRHPGPARDGCLLRRRGELEGKRRQPTDHVPLPAPAVLQRRGGIHERHERRAQRRAHGPGPAGRRRRNRGRGGGLLRPRRRARSRPSGARGAADPCGLGLAGADGRGLGALGAWSWRF